MSKSKRVTSAKTLSDHTVIEYSDGTSEKYYHESSTTNVDKTKTNSWNGSSGSSSGGSYGGGYTYAQSMKPTPAFQFKTKGKTIEFWGTAKSNLDLFEFKDGDLIINCTGMEWTPPKPPAPKLFIKSAPSWLKTKEVLLESPKKHLNGEMAQQICLDWPDMKPAPADADLSFWKSILNCCIKNNIGRIICCCTAGQGRTGTTLASLLLATEVVVEPDKAIEYIRKTYSSHSIETKDQEKYVFSLIYKEVDIKESTKPTLSLV